MAARAIVGLVLILLALAGLAAVLPGGRVDFNEFSKIKPPVSSPPTDAPDFSDLSDEAIEELLRQAAAGELSAEDLEALLNSIRDGDLSEEQLRRLAEAAANADLDEAQLERLRDLMEQGGLSQDQAEALLEAARNGEMSDAMADELERAIQDGMQNEQRTQELLDEAQREGLSDDEFDELLDNVRSGGASDEQIEELLRQSGEGNFDASQQTELEDALREGGLSDSDIARILAGAAAGALAASDRQLAEDALESSRPAGDLAREGQERRLSDSETRELMEANEGAGASGSGNIDPDEFQLQPSDPSDVQYPSDRSTAPSNPTCINLYSYSSTCHNRITVFDRAVRNPEGQYFFQLDDGPMTQLTASAAQSGETTSVGVVELRLEPATPTPVPALTPVQRLVGLEVVSSTAAGAVVTLSRDGNDMVWARADRATVAEVRLTWAIDLAYYDAYVPPGLTVNDVPASLRPEVGSAERAVGLQIANHIGVDASEPLDRILARLSAFFGGFGEGAIDPDEPDDMLAIAYSENGCCRHRSEAFLVTAQSLGIPTRMVTNEAHAFVEVNVPDLGWRLIDLGGCGGYSVADQGQEREIQTDPDQPLNENLENQPEPQPAIATHIEITSSPTTLRRGTPFTIGGAVGSDQGNLPADVPITIYYNRTKASAGTSFCSTRTDGSAGFSAQCTLPDSAPVSDLQFVARLAPAVIGGQPTAAAFSDPPIRVLSSTRILVVAPARVVLDAPTDLEVRLLDDAGDAVPGLSVAVEVDSQRIVEASTDVFGALHTTARFTTTGPHTIRVATPGDDHYEGNSTQTTIEAINLHLDATATPQGTPATEALVTGTLRDDAGPMDGVVIAGTLLGTRETATTDAGGRFTLRIRPDAVLVLWIDDAPPTPVGACCPRQGTLSLFALDAEVDATTMPLRPGVHQVLLSIEDVGASAALPLLVEVAPRLEATLPARWHTATPLSVPVRLAATGYARGYDGLEVATFIDSASGPTLTLDASGRGTFEPAGPLARGTHTIRFAFAGSPGYRPAEATATVVAGDANATTGSGQAVLAPGATWDVTATIRFDGAPAAGEAATLRVGASNATATTDDEGVATFRLLLPPTIPKGDTQASLAVPAVGFTAAVPLTIGEPVRIDLSAAGLSFAADTIQLRATPRAANGSVVDVPFEVRADGTLLEPAADGTYHVDASTWLGRTVTVEATSPGAGEFAASSSAVRVTNVNPASLTILLVVMAAAGAAAWWWNRRKTRTPAPAAEAPLASAATQGTVTLLRPNLPPGVPAVFDPQWDPALEFDVGGKASHPVTWDATQPAATEEADRNVRVALKEAPKGRHTLAFGSPGAPDAASFDLRVEPFHSAADQALRELIRDLRGAAAPGETIHLSDMERLLDEGHHVPNLLTRELRRLAEVALYSRDTCDRPTFETFWLTMLRVRSSLRKPQPEGG